MLQVQQAAPERAGGGQWVLCRYKDLVAEKERRWLVCEADRDGKGQVAASWLLTQKEKGERMEPAARTLEPTQREGAMQQRGGIGGPGFCTLIPWPWRAVA